MTTSDDGTTTDSDDPTIDPETYWTQVTQRRYDPDQDEELTTAIAESEGVAPRELNAPPLYECIDAEGLEATFFGPDASEEPRQDIGSVEFYYCDHLVKVRSDGWIQLYRSTESKSP